MNAVEIPYNVIVFFMIWPSYLETEPNRNQKTTQNQYFERIKPNYNW